MEGLPDWATQIPSIGAVGVFAMLVVHIWRISSSDRKDYQQTLRSLREQHTMEKEAIEKRHDAQLQECHDRRDRQHAEIDKLQEQLAVARRLQWEAEDAAAKYRRQVEGDSQ